ncbi:MAG TPA: DUF2948 family protein [Stellaceae bacterium]|nr:DUF2948 family protein [Stellaceae bacterium]
MAPDAPLRLRAEDADDLAVLSAVLQDALIAVRDLTYDRDAKRFTLVANRFRWEAKPNGADGEPAFERRLCAVTIEAVDSVSYRGFRRRDDERILSLLALRPGERGGTLELDFSGSPGMRLGIAAIRVFATDLGEAWPTAWQPDHSTGDTP